eukprot:1053471_1
MSMAMDEWRPQITISIRNVYRERNDINIEILPSTIELDFELFARFNQISKAFAFIAKMDYSLPPNMNTNTQKQATTQTTTMQTSSICIRFSVNNEDHMPRTEHIWFEFHELIATNEANNTKNTMWNLDCKKLNVLLEYKDTKHLILKSSDHNTLKIYINDTNEEYEDADEQEDSSDVDCDLQDAHFRWWESNNNDLKFPKGDKRATTRTFEVKAQRLSPTHVDIVLCNAMVACSKSQYDLFIQLYMKAIDSLEKVEAQLYAPLYQTQWSQSSVDMPCFAGQIIQETQSQPEPQAHFISSVKIVIKRGRVDINEDCNKNMDKKGMPVIEPTASSIMAQTFRLEFQSLQITHVVKQQEPEKVSYVVLRTNDICLLEFDEVLEPFGDDVANEYLMMHNNDEQDNHGRGIRGKAHPLLFKTLETQTFGFNPNAQQKQRHEHDVFHLFLSLRAKQTQCEHTFLQIFTLVNLRALSHEFRLESEWTTKLAEFFSVDVDASTEHSAPISASASADHDNDGLLQNVTNVYVHAYDCCISYNPIPVAQRLVITSEKIRISTNIVSLSPMASVSIECCDGAVYLHPNALKTFSKSLSQLFRAKNHLKDPFLHRLPGNLLADHLDSIGFVGILDFDWIEAFISQNKKITKNEISIKGGCIKVKTCEDSTKSLLSICKHFINQIIKQPNIEEVELFIPSDVVCNTSDADVVCNTSDITDNIKFNILGNIDEHMFAAHNDTIGIDSSSNSIGSDHDIEFITDYARTQSNPDSLNKGYVDLEEERELTTPFKKHTFKLQNQTTHNSESKSYGGGWYNKNDAHHSQGLDLNYLDKKLQEKFHALTDPNLPMKYPPPVTQIKIKEISLHWKIFGGLDFNSHENVHRNTHRKNEKHQFFQHEYEHENAHKNINYRSNRKVDEVMQVCLNNIELSFYQFHPYESIANRLVLSIHNVEVLDLIRESNFHKFLCFYRTQWNAIKSMKPMIRLEMNSMRAEPKKDPDRVETDVMISLLPLRLNVDQLAIDFLIQFFSSFVDAEEEEEEEEQTPEVEEEEELIMVDEEAILARLKTPTITKDTKHKTKKRKNKRKKPRKTNDANFLAINDETENNGSDGSGYEETAAALSSIRSKIANSDGRLITKHESQHSMTAIMDLVKKTKSNMALDLEILADKSSSEDPREDEEEELYMSALLTPSPDDSFSDHVQLIENMLKQPIVGAVPPKMHRKKSGKKTKRKKKNKNKHKKAKRAERAEIDIMKALQEDIKIQNTKDDITKAYMTTPEPDSNDSLNVDESHDSSSEEPPSFWNNSSMHDDQAMLQRMITNENQMLDAIMSPKLGFDDHLTKAELSSDWDDDELNNVKLVRKPKKKPVPKHKRGKKSTVPKGMDKKSRKKKHKRNKTMQ